MVRSRGSLSGLRLLFNGFSRFNLSLFVQTEPLHKMVAALLDLVSSPRSWGSLSPRVASTEKRRNIFPINFTGFPVFLLVQFGCGMF